MASLLKSFLFGAIIAFIFYIMGIMLGASSEMTLLLGMGVFSGFVIGATVGGAL